MQRENTVSVVWEHDQGGCLMLSVRDLRIIRNTVANIQLQDMTSVSYSWALAKDRLIDANKPRHCHRINTAAKCLYCATANAISSTNTVEIYPYGLVQE